MKRFAAAAAIAVMCLPVVASAQRPVASPRDSAARAALEQRARQRMADVVRERLALTDEQMRRLAAVRERNEQQRRTLMVQEREARMLLRAELMVRDSANQARVGQQLDRLIAIQRDRVALLEREQRELATFLTPVQRAQYLALGESVQRRMQGMRTGRAPGMMRPPAARAPGMPGRGSAAPAPRRPTSQPPSHDGRM